MCLSKGLGVCHEAHGWSSEWGVQHWVFPGGSDVPGENVEKPLL